MTVSSFVSDNITSSAPVLAILTTRDATGKFKGNRKNFIDIMHTGREMGFVVYVLPIEHLSNKKTTVKGFIYDRPSRKWIPQIMPYPNIIYNRIPLREDERLPSVRNKLNLLKKNKNVYLFNPFFFNKWRLYRWLKKSESTRHYIPVTKKLTTLDAFEQQLQNHSYLYLKPESGKAGKGIMTVSFKKDRHLPYRLKIQDTKGSITFNSSTINKLWSRIERECGNNRYIVQQGIQLANYRNRKYDLRALIQKNELGNWELTGLGARIAGITSITTHVPRGGSIAEPLKLLSHSFNAEMTHKISQKVNTAVVALAKQIEKACGYHLGEMSMDLGVDENGDIWFFEANSKPMKFDEPHIRQQSLRRIFQYSLYLLNQ